MNDPKPTAVLTLVQAAAALLRDNPDFSEWDLTIAAWTLDRERFGLPGYVQIYPDHKRVAMDLMGRTARDRDAREARATTSALFERTRTNHYRLTFAGWRKLWPGAIQALWDSPAFLAWQMDPAQPSDRETYEEALKQIGADADWLCKAILKLPRTTAEVASRACAEMHDFLQAMEMRFGKRPNRKAVRTAERVRRKEIA